MTMNFGFIFTNSSASGLLSNNESESETGLLSNNSFQYVSILSSALEANNGCIDAFGGKDIFGTCDTANMNETFFANNSVETAGSVACNSFDSLGSVASNSVETAGSVACSSVGGDSGASCGCGGFVSVC